MTWESIYVWSDYAISYCLFTPQTYIGAVLFYQNVVDLTNLWKFGSCAAMLIFSWILDRSILQKHFYDLKECKRQIKFNHLKLIWPIQKTNSQNLRSSLIFSLSEMLWEHRICPFTRQFTGNVFITIVNRNARHFSILDNIWLSWGIQVLPNK